LSIATFNDLTLDDPVNADDPIPFPNATLSVGPADVVPLSPTTFLINTPGTYWIQFNICILVDGTAQGVAIGLLGVPVANTQVSLLLNTATPPISDFLTGRFLLGLAGGQLITIINTSPGGAPTLTLAPSSSAGAVNLSFQRVA
jgi:hypothetical protein